MSKISESGKNVLYHKIYNLIYDSPRIPLFRISQKLGISRNSASRYLKEMYEKGILFGPEMRLKSFPSMREYCYFLKAEEPLFLYERLKENPDIIYACMYIGDWDLLVRSSKALNFSSSDGVQILAGGRRGDFFYPKPKLQSWEKAYKDIEKIIEDFSGEERSTLEYNYEDPTWKSQEWKLFEEFQYNIRKKILPVLKKHNISWEIYENWHKSLPQYATIYANIYPEGYESYIDLSFLVESNYEKNILKIFRELPTSTIFFKIPNELVIMLKVRKENINPSTKKILEFISIIKEKKMVDKYMKAIDILHFRKN